MPGNFGSHFAFRNNPSGYIISLKLVSKFDNLNNVKLSSLRFITECAEQGMPVLLRVGPYICAEWDYGGIPAWVMNIPGMAYQMFSTIQESGTCLRCINEDFSSFSVIVHPPPNFRCSDKI